MQKDTHFMLDLETMATSPDAAICQIAMVKFWPTIAIHAAFSVNVNLASSVAYGGKMDPDTVLWWFKQPEQVRAMLTSNQVPLHTALTDLSQWLDKQEPDREARYVWGNGSDFDNVILTAAYRQVGVPQPWNFRNNRCFRTLRELLPSVEAPPRSTSDIQHTALGDARYQAIWARFLLRALHSYTHPAAATTPAPATEGK